MRNGHNFPFCGLFRCTCGSMISAQWAKDNGGLYRFYRCTKKNGVCLEGYTQAHAVIAQCLEALKPLAITSEQAETIHKLIDKETDKSGEAFEAAVQNINERVKAVQDKLNKLTRAS